MSVEPLSFHFCVEKIAGEGEDAEPLLLLDPAWISLLAVFDGLGGAGSAAETRDGSTHSGAYYAARFARELLERYWQGWQPETPLDQQFEVFAGSLKAALQAGFRRAAADFGDPPSRIRGTMIRRLPTTLAAAWVERTGAGQVVSCLWAGDSRVYALLPESGLAQLTSDDLARPRDALQNLRADATLSNCINADSDFSLRCHQARFSGPFVLLAATDGCFGYLPTPMHFEFLLLDALMRAADLESWQANLVGALRRVSGDDFSLALVGFDFTDFNALRQSFVRRSTELWQTYIQPLDALYTQVDALNRQAEAARQGLDLRLSELWQRYRQGYEAVQPAGQK